MSDDLIFHYRALAAAGDETAAKIIKGMEICGAKTVSARRHATGMFLLLRTELLRTPVSLYGDMRLHQWCPQWDSLEDVNTNRARWQFTLYNERDYPPWIKKI